MVQLIKGIVDTQKNNYRSIGQVSVGDDLELELEVKMNCQSIQFLNPQAELLIKKADGNRVRQTKDILYQGGKFKIKVDEQGASYPGIVTNQLTINDDGRVSTCLFYFNVGTSLDREVLQSISKIEVLEELDKYIPQAFANLDEYEKRIIAGDETIRNLNNDINEAEKNRGATELERQETFKILKENMNEAITNLEHSINSSNLNEEERSGVFNSLKSNLESIKQDLINLNTNVELEEEKRVQAEIDRVNKALEIIGKLESTNDKVTIAEAERVTEFNNIKSELTSLKEVLTTINNTANSNEEVRKKNETARVAAEKQRVADFEKIKTDNTSLGVALTKKVDDKIVEIETNNNTFKEEINKQYKDINTKNNEFKEQMNTDFGNAKVDYFGEEHLNVVDRLNSDFDNVHQRINEASYLEYEGSSIKADNSYYGLTKDLTVKGRVLQNLASRLYTGIKGGNLITTDSYSLPKNQACRIKLPYNLTINTNYTLIVNVLSLSSNKSIQCRTEDGGYLYGIGGSSLTKLGLNVIKFTCSADNIKAITFKNEDSEGDTLFSIENNVMLLEGDYTNTPLEELSFGEGIYSVGENEVTEEGKYPISIKSCGKNILSPTNFIFQKNLTEVTNIKPTVSIEENKILITRAYVEGASHAQGICLNKIYLNVGDVVRFKGNVKNITNVRLYGENDFISTICHFGIISDTSIFTQIDGDFTITKSGHYYIRFWLSSNEYGSIAELENCILTVNNSNMEYEPYQESTQKLQLIEPLRSLPNGVCDEILEDGTEIRRVGKIVLNGSEGWDRTAINENTLKFDINSTMINNMKAKKLAKCLCSNIPVVNNSNNDDFHCRFSGSSPYGTFTIWIDKNKLVNNTTSSFLEWLQINPVTVYYELAEPIIKKHNKNINLKTFEGKTHITSDNYLLPTLSCKVPSNVQAIIMNLKEENEELNNIISVMSLKNEEIELENIETNLDQDVRLTMLELGVI